MLHSYDIFKVNAGETLSWQDAVGSVEAAMARIEQLTESTPGAYLISNHRTGFTLSVTRGSGILDDAGTSRDYEMNRGKKTNASAKKVRRHRATRSHLVPLRPR
jgi:hypothetical protein